MIDAIEPAIWCGRIRAAPGITITLDKRFEAMRALHHIASIGTAALGRYRRRKS
jgi:hypothetical protein